MSIITVVVSTALLLLLIQTGTVVSFAVLQQSSSFQKLSQQVITTNTLSNSQIRTSTTTTVLFGKKKVFIDGEAGTTGIQVRDRLANRDDLEILSAPTELRKDDATRKKLINEADAVILCKLFVLIFGL
jgi:hypothetical protein